MQLFIVLFLSLHTDGCNVFLFLANDRLWCIVCTAWFESVRQMGQAKVPFAALHGGNNTALYGTLGVL